MKTSFPNNPGTVIQTTAMQVMVGEFFYWAGDLYMVIAKNRGKVKTKLIALGITINSIPTLVWEDDPVKRDFKRDTTVGWVQFD